MSALVLTRRDIIFFKYLHACKVANTKQINRDIFRVGHRTCQYRLMKLSQKKFIEKMPSFKDEDKSFVFSLSSKGMKAVNVNFENLIHGKRYRSDSIEHDLKLVNIRNIFLNFKMTKNYLTENQLQTYDLSNLDNTLNPLKEMRVDAVAWIQDNGKPKLMIPIELEISTKSASEYLNKITEIYYQSSMPFLFCICDSKETEKKIKKIEQDFIKDGRKKIFYSTYKDIISHHGIVNFISLDQQIFSLK